MEEIFDQRKLCPKCLCPDTKKIDSCYNAAYDEFIDVRLCNYCGTYFGV